MDIRKIAGKAKGYNFMVFLGPVELPCSKVSGIMSIKDTETIAEGGVDNRVYTLDATPSTEKILILERGASLSVTADYILQPGYRFSTDILVFVLDIYKVPRWLYTFTGGYVKKVSYTDFDAMRSEIVIEKMEIAYEWMLKAVLF